MAHAVDMNGGPRRRVVLLGASNLTMGIGRVWRTLRAFWPEPLDLLAAMGHGRSFGASSSVLGRVLPGITECRLWDDLSRRPPLATTALITDIGNDILYGAEVRAISGWVETCLERLKPACETIVLSELPAEAAASLGERRFHLLRTLFFPGSAVTLAGAQAGALDLNERLRQLAAAYGARLAKPETHWFGFDAIHFRLTQRSRAWQTYLAPLSPSGVVPRAFGSSSYWWAYLASRRPSERSFFGRAFHGAQPAVTLRDGSTLSFY